MEANKENEIKLPEAVAKLYKPAPGAVRKNYVHQLGEVDLNSIAIKHAEKLVSKGLLVSLSKEKEEKKTLS